MLNIDRILKVAEAIENDTVDGVKFNMDYFNFSFNKIKNRCIAGYVQELFPAEFHDAKLPDGTQFLSSFLTANHVLGLDQPKGDFSSLSFPLYFPRNIDMNYGEITRQQAAKVLRHFAKTGEVNWYIIRPRKAIAA